MFRKVYFGGSFASVNNILLKHDFSLLKPLSCDRLEAPIGRSQIYETPINIAITSMRTGLFWCVGTSLASHYFKN